VEAFLAGAREAGAETENVFLAKKKIAPCIACYACWMKTPGKCTQRDDMDELLDKVIASDVVVFATPVYVDNVTGIMKDFMDRLIAIGDPHWERDENGECRHLMRNPKPAKIVVISNCGFPQQSHFQVIRLYYRRVARNIHADRGDLSRWGRAPHHLDAGAAAARGTVQEARGTRGARDGGELAALTGDDREARGAASSLADLCR